MFHKTEWMQCLIRQNGCNRPSRTPCVHSQELESQGMRRKASWEGYPCSQLGGLEGRTGCGPRTKRREVSRLRGTHPPNSSPSPVPHSLLRYDTQAASPGRWVRTANPPVPSHLHWLTLWGPGTHLCHEQTDPSPPLFHCPLRSLHLANANVSTSISLNVTSSPRSCSHLYWPLTPPPAPG